MASTIAASTAGGGGIIQTADASGNLNLQSGTTTILALTSTGVAITGTLSATGVTTVAAGSAALPAITTTGDTDTGVWFPAANTLAASTAGVERMRIDSSGNLLFNSGYGSAATAYGCRAWVNFNGTGTVAIRASGNVSSITDNGTGDYTVNFTTAMPDINYSTVISYSQDYGVARCVGAQLYLNGISGTEQAPTTTTARFVATGASAAFDAKYACVSIFR